MLKLKDHEIVMFLVTLISLAASTVFAIILAVGHNNTQFALGSVFMFCLLRGGAVLKNIVEGDGKDAK